MVSKLFITYVEGKTNKREVLDVMARILNFSEEEKQRIGLTNSRWSLIPKFGSESEKNKSPAEKVHSRLPPLLISSKESHRLVGGLFIEGTHIHNQAHTMQEAAAEQTV